jgi:flagellar biosynthetic protein FliR
MTVLNAAGPTLNQAALVFVLALARVGALYMAVPHLGGAMLPVRVRACLAAATALLLTVSLWRPDFPVPGGLMQTALWVAGEAAIGLALGFGVAVVFAALQVAGQIIAQVAGTSIGDVFNPGLDENMPIYSVMLYYLALAIFVLSNGHELLLASLLETYRVLPPASNGLLTSLSGIAPAFAEALTQSFGLGIRVAAPVMTALLLSALLIGLIGRTMPQFNILAIGFGLNSFVALGAMAMSLGAMAWVFEDEFASGLDSILSVLAGASRFSG